MGTLEWGGELKKFSPKISNCRCGGQVKHRAGLVPFMMSTGQGIALVEIQCRECGIKIHKEIDTYYGGMDKLVREYQAAADQWNRIMVDSDNINNPAEEAGKE